VPYRLAKAPNKFGGAGNGAQTRDLCLGKAALYQLSYSRICFNTLYSKAINIIPKIIIIVNSF
jgi:hypothetical protein